MAGLLANLNFIRNLDLLLVAFTISAIIILGFAVFFNNHQSSTNRTFLSFSLAASVYSIFNYASYQVNTANSALWLIRLVIASAIWYAFLLFQLLYIFPEQNFKFPKLYKFMLIPAVLFTSIVNLTPFVFQKVREPLIPGQVAQVVPVPGTILFGLLSISLVFGGVYSLLKRLRRSSGVERTQLKYVFTGTAITYCLIIIFNLILPVIFKNVRFVPLAPLFTIPFIALTAYAIMRHHLLDVKVITTEIFTFLLSIVSFFEVVLSKGFPILIFRSSIFCLVLTFGVLLIKSVRKEIEQREQLEILSSQLAEANEKLKALDQARAEFISIASHQLRTPPATVKWYLSSVIAGDYGRLPKGIREILVKTERSNNLLISLIEDLLNVSRIERGTMEFLFEEVDPLDLAKLTFEQLEPLAREKRLQFKFYSPKKPLPKITADREKLRQVMNNLIDNAIKYTSRGKIEVKIYDDGQNLGFQVKDTGKGIAKDEIDKIFKKYTRGKESVHHSAGLGLGLYVAKIVIEQHQGRIWAESPGPGKGSLFNFTIPKKQRASQAGSLDFSKG